MWLTIISAIAFGAFALYLIPRAKFMIKNGPKGSSQDWRGFLIIIAVLIVFVFMLIKLV
jgi:hypothetical protein